MNMTRKGAAGAVRALLIGTAAFLTMGASSQVADPITQVAAANSADVAVAAPAPTFSWSVANARELVRAIQASREEGLRPADYNLAGLRRAIDGGESQQLDMVAQAAALSLARDYFLGRVSDRSGMDWHIARPEGGAMLPGALSQAMAAGKIGQFYTALLPASPRYVALREALATADDAATRDRIRANMERWRWMPRTMGDDYLYVNVPSYQLQLVQDGAVASTYTVVVGAPDTPTPQLVSEAPSLVVNPWWNVPASIVKKSGLRAGRGGYVFKANGSGVAQPPGPHNALGKLKINLIDTPAIYLHDTNAKAGFARDARALSHGCVRVKEVDQLAAELMTRGGGDSSRLEEALAGNDTETLALPKRWGVYLVYFTMDEDPNGTLVSYGDPYKRDATLIARLDGTPGAGAGLQIASN